MTSMTIGKAAAAAGVNVETIRFYERRRLIEQPAKPRYGGYRSYPEETIRRVRFIRHAQELGFSLREIGDLLDLRATTGVDAGHVRRRAIEKLRNVDGKIERLELIRMGLAELLDSCPGEGALQSCSILGALERENVASGRARKDHDSNGECDGNGKAAD